MQSQTVKIEPHGFVRLVDVLGSDESIESAARVSYSAGDEGRKRSDTRNLLRYLMRHKHTSPFEMAEFVFHIKAPIFVARQWVRHRTASWNEVSGRYSVLPQEFWSPQRWLGQASSNKQGSDEANEVAYTPSKFMGLAHASSQQFSAEQAAFHEYDRRVQSGVSKEDARTCVPVSTYTEWYWKIDLHNLMGFLHLRMDPHAQYQMREYAEVISKQVQERFPISWEAFVDYRLESITLSRLDVLAMRSVLATEGVPDLSGMSERESAEFYAKMERLVSGN